MNTDFFENKNFWLEKTKYLIYTGPIDRFYNYKFGHLEYKTTEFLHKKVDKFNFQGTAVMNFTDKETPFTRIIEHKHFEKNISPCSWITTETPIDFIPEKTEYLYPVNDTENMVKYNNYKKLSDEQNKIYFGGRLGEYKYYDMHNVIDSVLIFLEKIKQEF